MRGCVLRLSALVFIVLPAGSPSGAQRTDAPQPIYREQPRLDKELQAQITAPPSQVHTQIDRAQVKRDAEDLARIAQSIPAEVAGAEKGTVSKDLNENLKKIQKLCKRLRSELAL